MARPFPNYEPVGVVPAALLPFTPDLEIDEPTLRRHIGDIAATEGISSILVGGVAQEGNALTADEHARIIDIMASEVGDRVPLMHGIVAEGGRDAAVKAREADRAGASCLLVFPPSQFARGSQARPDMVIAHYQAIADATDLPLLVFQYEMSTGQGHALDTLVRLVETVPSVRAIKDRCNHPVMHEQTIRAMQSMKRPVHVLTTHSAWLLSSLVLGCNGMLSGAGSVFAADHVALWNAVQKNDLATARAISDRLYDLNACFYKSPILDMFTRMKEALVLQGRFPSAAVRLPWLPVAQAERDAIGAALEKAGLLGLSNTNPKEETVR